MYNSYTAFIFDTHCCLKAAVMLIVFTEMILTTFLDLHFANAALI